MAGGKRIIGVDIGSSQVKVCQLTPTKRGYELLQFGMAQLPPESIIDGAMMNRSGVADTLRDLIRSHKIKGKQCVVGLSGHSVIIKKINMPQQTPEELQDSIQWEAEQYIPFDIKDVSIDVQILNPESAVQGQMDVMLVAAKKEMINEYTSLMTEAGLQPVVCDVDMFAVANQFEANYELPPNETMVLVNIGAAMINIVILEGGASAFTRDISMGGNQFTEEIQKQLSVSYEEAEALKIGGAYGGDQDEVVPQEVEGVIQMVSQTVAGELQRSLDFYAATATDAQISKLYLSGGTAKIPALQKTIEQRLQLPVEVMNPFRNIEVDAGKFDPDYLHEVSPMAAVSVGLALRRPHDNES